MHHQQQELLRQLVPLRLQALLLQQVQHFLSPYSDWKTEPLVVELDPVVGTDRLEQLMRTRPRGISDRLGDEVVEPGLVLEPEALCLVVGPVLVELSEPRNARLAR